MIEIEIGTEGDRRKPLAKYTKYIICLGERERQRQREVEIEIGTEGDRRKPLAKYTKYIIC